MRALVAGVLTVFALVSLSEVARAADAVTVSPAATMPADTPLYVWSGPYAGVFVGYNWSNFDGSGTADGVDGGGYAGYNWQAGKLIFGLEGDAGYSGADIIGGGLRAREGAFGSVRGRVGVDLNPFMLYATGGLAAAGTKLEDGTSSDAKTSLGWTAGAGAEAAVTDNVTARIEYRYSDYGSKTYDLNSGPVSKGFDEQSVRAGIGIKF